MERQRAQEQRQSEERRLNRLPNYIGMQQAAVDTMWKEFRADHERAGEYRLALLVQETEQLAEHIEQLYYAADSNDLSERDLNRRSEDIEGTTGRLTELVNNGSDPPQINVAPLPDEGVDERIWRLVNLSNRLIPNILFLIGQDTVNLDLLNQIRDDLAITGALTRALPESEF